MPTTPDSSAFDRGVRPLLQLVLPEKAEVILSYTPDPVLRDRIDELAERSTEGLLSDDERA